MVSKQAVILAGGRGLRLQERTHSLPKALMSIASRPILDHILYHLSVHGVSRVLIAGGYKFSELVSNGFDQVRYGMDVELIDTGLDTNTGGRIKALQNKLENGPFLMAWCDALSDIDLTAMYKQHTQNRALVTLGAVHPPARFGDLILKGDRVVSYAEKASQQDRWISGGYFVIEPSVLGMIPGQDASWEHDVLPGIMERDRLQAYKHHGAWQCMDTIFEYELLNSLYESNQAFWPIP
ncbi:MAG: NTP transferase domain-containing protein [Desulfobacterales bacterium]|nr:NTP transferase domain-containing protein [Desulfobacterales bacterium]